MRIDEADPNHRPEFFNILSSSDGINTVLGARGALDIARAEAELDLEAPKRVGIFLRGGEVLGREGAPHPALYSPNVRPYRGWVDIDLAEDWVVDWGRRRGLNLLGKLPKQGDHWVHYTHRPNWELYRSILWDKPGWDAVSLAASVPGQPRFA